MVAMTLVDSEVAHPSTMACQFSNMHRMPYNKPWNPYEASATTAQRIKSSALFLFLRNVLSRLLHELQQGYCFVQHNVTVSRLIPYYISGLQ